MSQFTSLFFISFLAITALAETPPPAVTSPSRPAASARPSALSSPLPSSSPTTEDLVNSLSQADLQAVVTLLKANFTDPDAITDTELNRATVEGLIMRLPRGVMLLPSKENAAAEGPSVFYGEVIGGHIGYVRVGSLNAANLQALDKSLSNFAVKNVNEIVVDLRASQITADLSLATEFAKRFCPKGKTLFTLRKPTGRQDRVFSSDRDPAFRGLVMVLTDGDTVGAAEAIAAALRYYDKALVIGQTTAGRAAEYSDLLLRRSNAAAARRRSRQHTIRCYSALWMWLLRSKFIKNDSGMRLRRPGCPLVFCHDWRAIFSPGELSLYLVERFFDFAQNGKK